MAVTSVVKLKINFSQDIEYGQEFEAASNVASPGENELIDLVLGNNTITVPSGATGVVIIPPTGNTDNITLKGVAGDTGFLLHDTNPSYIALGGSASFVLNAADTITGVRFIWT